MPRKYTNKLLEMVENGVFDKVVILTAALNALSEDEVEQMCRANDLIEAMGMDDDWGRRGNPIKDAYEDGECPDCGQDIPNDVTDGDACSNCGHVFTEEKADDDPAVD
jgi:rubredoxin